ncbi:hypothetical protein GQ44DRAFT_764727 [Phaeosphaeriaceae sp. PMI808]|nr:hypothetical protein GQ44DRAFT_764727 [Phaeosphaeriaceae sp. PMI808]
MDIKSQEYCIMDTPGFDHGSELEVFQEVVKGIKAIRLHARIIGVLLVTPMHHTRVNEMDEKLLRFARAFCGDENLAQVTNVTTFWETHKEKQKQPYNTRLANRLEKVKELWSVQGLIAHYQHGRKYEGEQDAGVSLEWDEDREEIAGYAKDMIHRHYGSINPRELLIVQQLGEGLPPKQTAAGQSLGLTAESTHKTTSSNASSPSSAVPEPEEQNAEKLKQDSFKEEPPKKDPPQSASSLDRTSKQGTGSQTIKKGWSDYGLDILGTFVRNVHFKAPTRSTRGFSNAGMVSRGEQMAPRYNGPVDQNSVVDQFKVMGWDSSPANRAQVGQQLGISGIPGTSQYNDELRRTVKNRFL